jgi:predicted pyridoxine 5'-phosphate oxidase superfamily flavin-nucleotide-binding protein
VSDPAAALRARSPWHEGEQELQRRLGVRERMEAVGRRVLRDFLPEEHRAFYPLLSYLIVGSRDPSGQPWASILSGAPGFVTSPDPRRLRVDAWPAKADPLAQGLRAGAQLGLLGIDLWTRRRNRANGRVLAADGAGFTLGVEQSFGNCPRFIQRRQVRAPDRAAPSPLAPLRGRSLGAEDRALVAAADTFFVASAAPAASEGPGPGLDASHRGGAPGFVRVEDERTLLVPDHPGNQFFNTLGNLLLEPRCGLLFLDFEGGDLLQLAAEAELLWGEPVADRALDSGRWVRFHVREVLRRPRALGSSRQRVPV